MNNRTSDSGGWGAGARDWASVQEGQLRPLFETVLARTGVGPGTDVLDIACGTGLFCVMAAERGATVSGADGSAEQLAVARERLPESDFVVCDIETACFPDDAFDLVTCCNALQYAKNPVNALKEMRMMARAGATVAILGRSINGPNPSRGALAQFQPPAPGAPPMTISRVPGALQAAITEAELSIYADEEMAFDWVYPDLETMLRGFLAMAPSIRAVKAVGEEKVRSAYSEAFAPYQTADGSYRLPYIARYVLAHP